MLQNVPTAFLLSNIADAEVDVQPLAKGFARLGALVRSVFSRRTRLVAAAQSKTDHTLAA